jgi:hypothetical protein
MKETINSSKKGSPYRIKSALSASPILRFALSPILLLLLFSCSQLFSKLDNPADPKADDYQGYPTVEKSADIRPVSPPDAGTLVGTTLTMTKVGGATAYEFVLAASAAALSTSPILDKSDYSTNVIDISAAPIADSTTYYWKAKAKESNGNWGDWSTIASFSTKFHPAATPIFSPPGGTYTTDQTVTISCTTANSAIYYTTNGDTPTTDSTKYTGTAITATINPPTTIKAIAAAPWYTQSAVTTATYREYSIGDTGPAGGLIFYDKGSYSSGWRYLEAAPSDQSTDIQWDNGSSTTTGASGTAIGTGAANTTAIVASQGAGSYAAKLCDDLVLGGYSDWFLPSKDELNQMYVNLKQQSRGGIASTGYWSSSEYNSFIACYQNFDVGHQGTYFKYYSNSVRAARAF